LGGWPGQGGFAFRSSRGGAGQFSDFFEMFFGPGGVGGGFEEMFTKARAGQGRRTASQDSEAELTIALEEAMHGATRRLTISDPVTGQSKTADGRIPAGATDGTRNRLRGQGAGGSDLIITIHLAPHPAYEVSGHDLTTDLRVTPWDAALGAKASLTTPSGAVTVTIPPGTQSGQKLRLAGRGLPKRK